MAGKFQSNQKKKKKWPWIVGICVLAAILAVMLVRCNNDVSGKPTLTLETPQKISRNDSETITLDVTISDLGDARYPAMSMSVSFDASRLEFVGIQEGNLFIYDDTNGVGQKLPEWSCNVQNSNDTGMINIMYLDLTGGRYAFSKELLAEDDNVVLRLQFRLRGSARQGDVLNLIFEDAVFAASDETQSLAMTTNTLRTRNGKIVVGE